MKKYIFCLSFLFVSMLSISCFAQNQDFLTSNKFYKEGRYAEAAKGYKDILNQGIESGNLYYNLGNSYFKLGNLGSAILNYVRAKRLIPRDSDLRLNLNLAVSKISRYASPKYQSWPKRFLNLFNDFTIDELSIFSAILSSCNNSTNDNSNILPVFIIIIPPKLD